MAPSTLTRGLTIKVRIDDNRLQLIDQAAEALGMDRTSFMLDAATELLLRDRCVFKLDDGAWDGFQALLDAAPAANPKLRELLTSRAPWEE